MSGSLVLMIYSPVSAVSCRGGEHNLVQRILGVGIFSAEGKKKKLELSGL
jgi:hypothetical protein